MAEHPVEALEALANSNFHLTVQDHPEKIQVKSLPSLTCLKHVAVCPAEGNKPLHWNYNSRERGKKLSVGSIHFDGENVQFDLETHFNFLIYTNWQDCPYTLDKNAWTECTFESYRRRVAEIMGAEKETSS